MIALTSETVTRGVSYFSHKDVSPGLHHLPSVSQSAAEYSAAHGLQDPTGLHSPRYTKFTCKSVGFRLNQRYQL